MKTTLNKTLIAGAMVLAAIATQAQPSAHYVPGLEGVKGATLPPPGLYLRDYNIAYYADRINGGDGERVPGLDAELFVYANAPRIIWITDLKVLGGYIGFDALVPFQYTDLELNAGPTALRDDDFGIGDAFGEVTWSAHGEQYDLAFGYGIWVPTGDSNPRGVEAGAGFYTHMFTAGLTYYMDPEKQWSLSLLNRYEINHETEDTDITRGQAWTVEGGFGYGVSKTVEIGAVAYYQKQVTSDSGFGSEDGLDWVVGVGPEIGVMYPRYKLGWSLRYLYEFAAEYRAQGHTAALTITKVF